MINVLIIEDDLEKFGKVREILLGSNVASDRIIHALNAAQAVERLRELRFDLLLLDINIPRRFGEGPIRGGGMAIISELRRDNNLNRPSHIVGVTAFEDVVAEFGDSFAEELWGLVTYSENSDRWIHQIRAKIEYLNALKKSGSFSDGVTFGTDLVIVCALQDVELGAVKSLPCGWQPLRMKHDETRYIIGSIDREDKSFSIVAAAAPRMGMPAAAVLAAKMIAQFRPRFVAMTGICAGKSGKVNLGDIIVADPSWDWGSGKVYSEKDEPRFRPSPHHVEMDIDFRSKLAEVSEDVGLLARIKASSRGNKPNTELKVHFGPLASGASVVAHQQTFDDLLEQHRDLLGIEMEAYGVVAACRGTGKPRPQHLIVKAVCDFADKDKTNDHQEYAAHTSALFLYHAALDFL